MSSSSFASVLTDVQNDILDLLSQMPKEFAQLEAIDAAKANVENLKEIKSSVQAVVASFGERFFEFHSRESQKQPENFQKISKDKIFTADEDLAKIKGAEGGFAQVAVKDYHNQKVAVKILQVGKETSGLDKVVTEEDIRDEIHHLRALSHDNIVAFRGWGVDRECYFLVMEYLDTNLKEYVLEQESHDNHGLTSRLTWEIAKQIAQAMVYLHSLEIPIAHLDLKPDNILLDTKPIIPKPKLCDFGLALHSYAITSQVQKGHIRYRPQIKEEARNMDDLLKFDVYAFGLVTLFMRTGKQPYPDEKTQGLQGVGTSSTLREKDGRVYIRRIPLPSDLPDTELGEMIKTCCSDDKESRPGFTKLLEIYFKKGNPFNLAEKGMFFECGFLKETYIFVADSIVEDSNEAAYTPTSVPPGYQRRDLICAVMIKDAPYRDKPDSEALNVKYKENYNRFRKQAKQKIIDDNPAIALKILITDRSGDDEEQRVELEYKQTTYCHHRAMREIWRSFESYEKEREVPCMSDVHPLYSTSFGLHVAVLTNEGPGKPKKFVFTRRSKKPGMATPGLYTCGAVESCSIKDYITDEQRKKYGKEPRDGFSHVSLIDTAARGLEEELGLPLTYGDRNAITLNTIYLKFDNHEWGMCGFVDLTSNKIGEKNRLSFDTIKSAFTSGPKDKFEHMEIEGVDFELDKMVDWIREHHDKLASSAKIVVVKVLQAFFGVAPVVNAFEKKM